MGNVIAKLFIEARQSLHFRKVNMTADLSFCGTPIFSNLHHPRKLRLNNTSHENSYHK